MYEGYFEGILILSSLFAMASGLVHPRLKNATAFGMGVLLFCSIMLPLVDIISDINGDSLFNELELDIDYNATDDMIEEAFERGISEYVADKYAVDVKLVSVKADGFDMEKMRADRIYVTLSGKAALLDFKKIEDEICQEFTSGGE